MQAQEQSLKWAILALTMQHEGVQGGAPGVGRARRGDLAVWPDQAAAAFASGAPCLGVLSLVRDTLELNYCTKLFHQIVHALSAR